VTNPHQNADISERKRSRGSNAAGDGDEEAIVDRERTRSVGQRLAVCIRKGRE
jgi:hypothetical protein